MSTVKYKLYENVYVKSDIHYVVNSTQKKELAEFVRTTIRDKNLSYRKVAANSRGLITHSTVSDVVNKRVANPTDETKKGLAKGLGVAEEIIYAIVRGSSPDLEKISNERFARMAERYALIPEEEREKFEIMIGCLEAAIFEHSEKYLNTENSSAENKSFNTPEPTATIEHNGKTIPIYKGSKKESKTHKKK